jgi:membrane-associated protease RseP (regulator of RpoE activity)
LPFDPPPVVWPASPKFQHRYLVHAGLFVLTLATTTLLAGWIHYAGFLDAQGRLAPEDVFTWPILAGGLWYSLPLLAILGAHEFGHYWYCRRHDVDASLPYFLPAPLPLTGTFGAVIRIRQAFPTTRALFDIGVAGPIAGFIVLLPFLYWGTAMSAVVRPPEDIELIYFGEPLLFRLVAAWQFGPLPDGFDIVLHPMGFAAWFGMLATALNLLPFGQLDGGHIAYAAFGRWASTLSKLTLAATLLLTLRSFSWIAMALIMVAMAIFLGFGHPQVADGGAPLDRRRRLIAIAALIIFVLCFTPVPIQTFWGG